MRQRTERGRCPAVVIAAMLAFASSASAAVDRPTTLADAVKRGDRPAIDSFMSSRGVDVNQPEPDGTTPLHWAAYRGDFGLVSQLLRAGARATARNRYGITPIWTAAEIGHGPVVDALLKAGANPNTTRGDSGETLAMIAARGGHVDVLRHLLARGADVNAREHVRGQTALMWAAAEGYADAAGVLARAGAALEARSSTGITPLLFAVRAGHIRAAGALLDAGASLTSTAPFQAHHFDGWRYRVEGDLEKFAPDGTTPLVLAIVNAHWELAAYLVERGADPNGNDSVHGRPLQALAFVRRAANRGLSPIIARKPTGVISSLDLAKVLIKHGAVVDDPINWARAEHRPPHMSLQFFATISFVGATPFLIAAKMCDIEMMQLFLEHGADPNRPTVQGVTPLLAASGVGFSMGESPDTPEEALKAVQFLHSVGAELRVAVTPQGTAGDAMPRTYLGSNVLHGAVAREAPELVAWLIEHGAPLEAKDARGQTALDSVGQLGLNTTRLVRDKIGRLLREAMIAKGLPVPDVTVDPSAKR